MTEYDCQTCGACCTSPWTGPGYVRLYDGEREQIHRANLPVIEEEHPDADPPETFFKLGTKFDLLSRRVCAALKGIAGQSCTCSIYDTRPFACHQFEVGGQLCLEVRKRIGISST